MPDLTLFKESQAEQVYDKLYELILASGHAPRERLAPIRTLAKMFDTSVSTIQQAMNRLEENGYIVRKHGAGTYITSRHRAPTVKDMVPLCIGGRGQHVWGDLSSMLGGMLYDKGHIPVIIERERGGQFDLDPFRHIKRMTQLNAKLFIIRDHVGLPHELVNKPSLDRKTIIAVVDWFSLYARPGLIRVLTDPCEGGRLVAEHLYNLGHRKVLVVSEPFELQTLHSPIAEVSKPGLPFTERFAAMGGRWEAVASGETESECTLDEAAFLSHFEGDDPPTAVFGLRDVEAWMAQNLLHRHRPDIARKVAVIGYYDTPWSQAASTPFTTVNLNLPVITAKVRDIVDVIDRGQTPDSNVLRIPPLLVVRGTSVLRSVSQHES